MTDRPILFSAPMIRALLAGHKTQTRRVLKPQPVLFPIDEAGTPCRVGLMHVEGDRLPRITLGGEKSGVVTLQEVRFAIGDRLWVKETFARGLDELDGEPWPIFKANYDAPGDRAYTVFKPWTSSLYMPRNFSRLTLTVNDVRVQRLQEISAEDARDEGVDRRSKSVRQMWLFGATQEEREAIYLRACVWEYEQLWDGLNAKRGFGWETNPWIVAVSFNVEHGNIDKTAPVCTEATPARRA